MAKKPIVKFVPATNSFGKHSIIMADEEPWGAIGQDINLEFYVAIRKTLADSTKTWKILKGGFRTEEEAKHWVKTLIIPLTALHGG